MLKFFLITVILVACQRIAELFVAKNNAYILKSRGGYEVGGEHYKFFVILHAAFFISLFVEVIFLKTTLPSWWKYTFLLFLAAQGLRLWCIKSLGEFWNTRIIILPGMHVATKGPYRYLRHPNYLVVILEFLTLPLTFDAIYTAVTFSFLNILLLSLRIPKEEEALFRNSDYCQTMQMKNRFLPLCSGSSKSERRQNNV